LNFVIRPAVHCLSSSLKCRGKDHSFYVVLLQENPLNIEFAIWPAEYTLKSPLRAATKWFGRPIWLMPIENPDVKEKPQNLRLSLCDIHLFSSVFAIPTDGSRFITAMLTPNLQRRCFAARIDQRPAQQCRDPEEVIC
jgi:hypothetical protein